MDFCQIKTIIESYLTFFAGSNFTITQGFSIHSFKKFLQYKLSFFSNWENTS